VLFYLPLIVDRLCRAERDRRARVTLFLLLLAQGLVDIVYLAPAALAPVLVIAGARLARGRTRRDGLAVLGVAGLVMLVLAAIHWPWLAFAGRTPDLASESFWRGEKGRVLDLPWGLLGWLSPLAVPTVALAVIVLGGVKALVRRWRGALAARDRLWKHAALWAIVGTVLSLRPHVRWRSTNFVLPHLALAQSWLPFLSFVRVPPRLGVAGLVGLALLAGVAFAELTATGATDGGSVRARLLRPILAIALALAMYAQYARGTGQPHQYGPPLPHDYPLRAAIRGHSPVVRMLRRSAGPALELPLDPSVPTYPEHHAVPMYRSIFHWQPLLNGYASYWPREFPGLMALAARLPEPSALQELRRRTGLRFVLVRLTADLWNEERLEPLRELWRGIATRHDRPDLELVAADDELMLFRVR
jgi:hypothetical protein